MVGRMRSRGTSRGRANTWLHPQPRPQGIRSCALYTWPLATAWVMWFTEARTTRGASASPCPETLHL